MRRLVFILPVMALVLVGAMFAALLLHPRDPGEVPSPFVGRPVPVFSLPALGGTGVVSDADLKGRVTVFNVFASWCAPCRAEHPILMRMARGGKARVIGLNYKDKPADAERWLKELGNPFARIARDETGRTAIDFGVYGVPESFIIDARGIIRYKHVGPINANDYTDRIAPMIERLSREAAAK